MKSKNPLSDKLSQEDIKMLEDVSSIRELIGYSKIMTYLKPGAYYEYIAYYEELQDMVIRGIDDTISVKNGREQLKNRGD